MKKLFLFLFFMFAAGCSSGPAGGPPSLQIGSAAPSFSLDLLNGGKYEYKSGRSGKPLVLVYMASWCPCTHDSVPAFKEVYKEYNPKGVEFLMVGIQDSESKFKKFYKNSGLKFPAGFDYRTDLSLKYGVSAPPTTFFIDKEGKVKNAYYGKIEEKEKLAAWVAEIAG